MRIEFSKYEGAGNDFILLDTRGRDLAIDSKMVARLCDRHFGIGADGLMTLGPAAESLCTMRYYNADGSEGEMCGNGGRCFALFAEHLGLGGPVKRFEARDGMHTARLLGTAGDSGRIELGMIDVERIQAGAGWWFLNTGVPHYVEFVDDVAAVDVTARGRAIRYDKERFPQGTNVNFGETVGEGRLRVRTYERGVEAETLACGTGATAAAIVANYVRQPQILRFEATVPGGTLSIGFDRRPHTPVYSDIRLAGGARRVFRGSFDTENF